MLIFNRRMIQTTRARRCQHNLAHFQIMIESLYRHIDSAIELIAEGLTEYRTHGAIKNMSPLQDALRRVSIVGDAADMECICEYQSMVEIFGRVELIEPTQLEGALRFLLNMKPRQKRFAGEDVQTMIQVAHLMLPPTI
jgi:hypothetical protein